MYTAKLKSKSDVDASGRVEIAFEIYIDGELSYPNMTSICFPEQIQEKMQECMAGLIDRIAIAEEVPDNLTVTYGN